MFSHTERSEIYKSKILGPNLGALALNLTTHHSRSPSERPEICHCQKWYGSDLQALKD